MADNHYTRFRKETKRIVDVKLPEQFGHSQVGENLDEYTIGTMPDPVLRADSGEVVLWTQSMTGGPVTVSMISPELKRVLMRIREIGEPLQTGQYGGAKWQFMNGKFEGRA